MANRNGPDPFDESDRGDNRIGKYVHLPPRAIAVSVAEYKRRMDRPQHLTWGIADIDYRVVPYAPGDMITILGRPGMGKTSVMIYQISRFAEVVNTVDMGVENPIFMYATWETMVEEFMAVFSAAKSGYNLEDIGRGRADLGKIKRAMVSMMGASVAIFGRSMEDARARLPVPTLSDYRDAIFMLQDQGFTVIGSFLDYLQRIPAERGHDRRGDDRSSRVSENIEEIKDIGMATGVWNVVGVQAKREVDDYGGLKFPSMQDGQWTSSIEQATDKSFSVTMPAKYLEIGTEIKLRGFTYEVSDQTLGLKLLKQRFGGATEDDVWLLGFNAATVEMFPHTISGEEQAVF